MVQKLDKEEPLENQIKILMDNQIELMRQNKALMKENTHLRNLIQNAFGVKYEF
jgi:hypothetical protein